MKLRFNIDYHTRWGEHVCLTGNLPELGNGDMSKAIELTSDDGSDRHKAAIEISQATPTISYRYFIRRDDGSDRQEWGSDRTIAFDSHLNEVTMNDRWQDQPDDKPFYSQAFTDCIYRRQPTEPTPHLHPSILRLCVDAPRVHPDMILAISGSDAMLGCWDPAKALVLNDSAFPKWTIDLPIAMIAGKEIEYKFLLLRKSDHTVVGWDTCNNRILNIDSAKSSGSVIISGLHFAGPLPHWRGAGVAIPVFSLRSDKDFGVGDFYDIMLLVDWAASTGQSMIQLLPINDTTMTHTWIDSYPYNANSSFALHPMYLRISEMGRLNDRHAQSRFDALAKELNESPTVDYERVNRAKREFTKLLFDQQGEAEMSTDEFKKFVSDNGHWLKPYAAFCTLRDLYKTADMSHWEEYAVYSPSRIEKFVKHHKREIDYVCYIQFHLDRQLHNVRKYAHSKGIAIKGDIPIGISRNSVDAWTAPDLFNLNCSAGAPPDDFSIMGQNWGFPTYNWEVMARDGFAWWKARFRKMAEYFDAYRIDHVLGFFRIWQIPLDALHGLLGVFNSAIPLSPDEMRNNFDFHFDASRMTRPYIADWMLHDFFGDLTDQVRAEYLLPTGNGTYRLRDEFATQRQVAQYFAANNPNDERRQRISDGLLGLIDQVLFIEDPYKKGTYHPRIAAQMTYSYRALNDYERWAFNRLYDDFFYHRNNDYWRDKALWKLPPIIDATDMLVCAEDLGMIPACVPDVMNRLKILSLEIQRMPKDPSASFGDTWHYPYLSVCTTSTHDMGGIRQWWEEDREATQRYYNDVLHENGGAPYYAEPWICTKIVDLHLKSPSMLCILPLQDWLSTDGKLRRTDPHEEQINVPANSRHYWRYRMHITLEQLLDAENFNRSVREMTTSSGR